MMVSLLEHCSCAHVESEPYLVTSFGGGVLVVALILLLITLGFQYYYIFITQQFLLVIIFNNNIKNRDVSTTLSTDLLLIRQV